MWILSFLSKKKKKYVLVISWWGTRGFYGLWVLKWLEELGMKQDIKAVYAVSAWAIMVSYRTAGYSIDQIYDMFSHTKKFLNIYALNILSKQSLLKSSGLFEQFKKDLPKNISQLSTKVYIWVTNANTGKFIALSKGDLPTILLWSMSIPWIFPAVSYQTQVLMDGGVTNNFPVDIAKKKYSNDEIIGIALNRFRENQKISTVIDNLSVAFEILLRKNTFENLPLVEHPFCINVPLKVLDTDKQKMKKAYEQGYKECIEHFKK